MPDLSTAHSALWFLVWFLLLTFASFRVTRFFIHDSLIGADLDSGSEFSKKLFLWPIKADGDGDERIIWWRNKVKTLLNCPYCLGFWVALAGTCIALRTLPWQLGINGWFIAWAVAGASVFVYQITIKLMRP